MKRTKRIMSLVLIFVLAIGMTFATGCSNNTNEQSEDSLVLTVNDKKIYLDEMMYYISAVEAAGAQYDAYYQQFGSSYWDMEYEEGVTMRDQMKQYVMDTAIMYEILYDKATKAGYTLTDEEKTQAQSNAETIMSDTTEEQLEITKFTADILTTVQEKLIIGEKYYNELVEGFNIDEASITASINYDDYRQYKTEYINISTTSYDESGNSVELSEEEKEAALASITAALDKAKAGDEFAAIIEADETLLTYTSDFVYGDGNAETAYQDAAILLENDTITDEIIETEYGYYIIKMIDNNSSESYDAAVESAIATAEDEAFNTEYELIKVDYTTVINEEVWDEIVMGETTIISTDATTVVE